jgi:hypothetical protein
LRVVAGVAHPSGYYYGYTRQIRSFAPNRGVRAATCEGES